MADRQIKVDVTTRPWVARVLAWRLGRALVPIMLLLPNKWLMTARHSRNTSPTRRDK